MPEMLHKLLRKFLRFLESMAKIFKVFWWNFRKIARELRRNLREIEMETLLGKTEVIWNWRWRYYKKILKNFFEEQKFSDRLITQCAAFSWPHQSPERVYRWHAISWYRAIVKSRVYELSLTFASELEFV